MTLTKESIREVMRERGYTLLAHSPDYTWSHFISEEKEIGATVRIRVGTEIGTSDHITIELTFIHQHLLILKTPEFDFNHPRFADLYEKKMLLAKKLLTGEF